MIWKYYKRVRLFVREVSQDNISAHAASTAFFLFLSLIPLLMLVCAILPYTPITEAMLMQFAVNLTPHSTDALMVYLIGEVYDESTGILSAAAVVTIWIAAKGMLALMRGLNAVNGIVERRNYFVLRLEASFYTILMLAVLITTLTILVFGNTLAVLLIRQFPRLQIAIDLFMHIRFLPVWLVLIFIFALIYTYIPQIQTRLREQLPGALFAAIAWSGFSWGFSLYIDYFNGFNMYGKLTTVIIVMLWLYFCMYLLLVGAKINHQLKGRLLYFW